MKLFVFFKRTSDEVKLGNMSLNIKNEKIVGIIIAKHRQIAEDKAIELGFIFDDYYFLNPTSDQNVYVSAEIKK